MRNTCINSVGKLEENIIFGGLSTDVRMIEKQYEDVDVDQLWVLVNLWVHMSGKFLEELSDYHITRDCLSWR
jgi:hypothetical protein